MVLQGYFDDSGSSPAQSFYIIAGFVASDEDFTRLSDEWAEVLRREDLRYFKMSEAQALRGEFKHNVYPELRDKITYELCEIIARHVKMRVAVALRRADFDGLIAGCRPSVPEFDDPYFMLFWAMCRTVMEQQHRESISDPCDFIFDEQGTVGLRALQWWRDWPRWINPDRAHLIGSPPIFGNDAKLLPLQAADLYAWLMRKMLENNGLDHNLHKAFLRAIMPIRRVSVFVNRDRLEQIRADLALSHIAYFERLRT